MYVLCMYVCHDSPYATACQQWFFPSDEIDGAVSAALFTKYDVRDWPILDVWQLAATQVRSIVWQQVMPRYSGWRLSFSYSQRCTLLYKPRFSAALDSTCKMQPMSCLILRHGSREMCDALGHEKASQLSSEAVISMIHGPRILFF